MKPQILIIEDHPLYLASLRHMIDYLLGGCLSIAASSAEDGLRVAQSIPNPSLILLDYNLPGRSGIEAIRAFQSQFPSSPIIVVSGSEDRREAALALNSGVLAFVSKAVPVDMLSDIVKRVLTGALSAPEWITAGGQAAIDTDELAFLTPRQRETLTLLSKGHSNKEIGLHLGLAEVTVKTHMSSLFRALNVVNRTQAVLAARQLGLLSEPGK